MSKTEAYLNEVFQVRTFNNFCKYFSVLIISVKSCNVCVIYLCVYSNNFDLIQATCFIIAYLASSTKQKSL